MSETVEAVKNEFLTEKQELEHTQKNMEQDLTSAKHRSIIQRPNYWRGGGGQNKGNLSWRE